MTLRVEFEWEDPREVERWIEHWDEPEVQKILLEGARAFGQAGAPVLQSATPKARPGNPWAIHGWGNLAAVTRWAFMHKAIGVVIGAMGKGAFYRGWVVHGTKAHDIQRGADSRYPGRVNPEFAIMHPGATPNPYVDRAAEAVSRAGTEAAEKHILEALTK